MKTLACASFGMTECSFVAKGETDEEVISKAKEHLKMVHPDKEKEMMNSMTESEMKDALKSKIIKD